MKFRLEVNHYDDGGDLTLDITSDDRRFLNREYRTFLKQILPDDVTLTALDPRDGTSKNGIIFSWSLGFNVKLPDVLFCPRYIAWCPKCFDHGVPPPSEFSHLLDPRRLDEWTYCRGCPIL